MGRFARNFLCFAAAAACCSVGALEAKTTSKKPTAKKSSAKPTAPSASKLDRSKFHLLADGELPLAARGAIVIDGPTGEPLYEKNADSPQYPASTTKVMTALLVIEEGNLEQQVEVTLEDSKVPESGLNIKPGERFTRRQLLYGLMLKSANDVAHALGRDNAGSIEAFAAKMTQRAHELGAMNTSFRNPHGLHHPEHYTTARDLALIGRAAMQQPQFRQIVATLEYPWVTPTTVGQVKSHNRLLFEFPGCTGVKTGFTNPAQHALVSAALRDGREVISVVLHSTKLGKWEDSKLLLTYGFDHPVSPDGPRVSNN